MSHFEHNPFATRYVRPGAVSFQFLEHENAIGLIELLRGHQWLGEIVGPHGSGKSTLLQSLIPLLEESARNVKLFTLHLGESQLPSSAADEKTWNEDTQFVIDGYEQLSGRNRNRILKLCRDRGCGLLATSHEPTGLPVLYSTAVTLELVQSLVRSLQANGLVRIHDPDVAMSFARNNGNVRDVFFELLLRYFRAATPVECGDLTPVSKI